MRKKCLFVWSLVAALMMTACSDQSEEIQSGETARLEFGITFEGAKDTDGTRAQTTAIPVTSWAKSISQVQFFLYDSNGKVRYSKIETPSSTNKVFTYSDVPVGTNYTLVAVANANSASIRPYIQSAYEAWTQQNVRQKQITDMILGHVDGTFPTYNNPVTYPDTQEYQDAGKVGQPTGNKAYAMPAEIFMGSTTIASIATGTVANATVALKREVSLMRVRLQVNDTEAGVVNTNEDKGVDFGVNASVLIYTLPEKMGIGALPANGGVLGASNEKAILVGTTSFETTNPATADYSPNQIIDDNFKLWKDIVVFPNNGGRANDAAVDGDNDPSRFYFIVVTGQGKVGHKCADGKELTAPATLYWKGLIKKNFCPNTIREVNLTLKSGGTTDPIVEPVGEGGLIITVTDPANWSSNIQETNIIL